MPSNPSRRGFLAASATFAAATTSGCLDSVIGGRSNSTRKLTLWLMREDGPLRDRYVRDLAQTRTPWDEAAFEAALNDEPYTMTYREPFFARDEPAYAKRDGTYYELGSVVVDEVTVTRPVLRLYTVGRASELDSVPEYTAKSKLPKSDQRAVHIAYMAARARGNEGGVPWGLVQRGGFVYRDENASEDSAILGDSGPSHVEYRDKIYRVEVTPEEFHDPVYRPTVEPVAQNESAMEAILRARLVDAYLDRNDLSKEGRSVLREAQRDGGYSESHPFSDAFETVLQRLHQRAYVDGNVESDATRAVADRELVSYDGEYFEYRLEFSGADE